MSNRLTTRILMVALAAMMFSMLASADTGVVIYSDLSSWQARSTGLTSVNFNGLAPAGGYASMGNGFTQNGATFTSPVAGLYVVDPNFNPSYYTDWGTGDSLLQVNWGTVDISTAPVTSFSLYLNSVAPFGGSFVVTLLNGSSSLATFTVGTDSYPTATFVGFTSDTPFDTVSIAPINTYTLIQGIQYGEDPPLNPNAVAPVPEPGSLTLMGSGLLGLAGLIRRKLRK